MGLLNFLGLATRPDYLASPGDIVSPWASDSAQLQRVALGELLGEDVLSKLPLSRMDALQVPAVAKVRNLLVSTIAPLPLVARTAAGPLASQPTWLYRTDGQNPAETPFNRMAGIIDDLLFYGNSMLACERGAAGQVLRVARIPYDRWSIAANGSLQVDNQNVDSDQVIFINAPYEGLLAIGSPTLRGARDLELAWSDRAKYPLPLTKVKATDDIERSDAEIAAILDYYRLSRRKDGAAVVWEPNNVSVEGLGTTDSELFEKGRNAAVTSIGQLTNIRASMLDGTLSDSSSLTYTTAQGERSAYLTFDVPFWTRPIEDRLSQDDVIAAGSSIAFDFTELLAPVPAPSGAPRED